MSLSDFIKNILNIQDNNISFPEENYLQIIKKKDFFIKVFKGFLKSNHCDCPHCNSKNIVKNASRVCKVKYIPFQNYNIELELTVQRYICKDCKKTFSPSTKELLIPAILILKLIENIYRKLFVLMNLNLSFLMEK